MAIEEIPFINSSFREFPLDVQLALADYKMYGEKSYAFKNKDILKSIYRAYKISVYDEKLLKECINYSFENDYKIGMYIFSLFNTPEDIKKRIKNINDVFNSPEVFDVLFKMDWFLEFAKKNTYLLSRIIQNDQIYDKVLKNQKIMESFLSDKHFTDEIDKVDKAIKIFSKINFDNYIDSDFILYISNDLNLVKQMLLDNVFQYFVLAFSDYTSSSTKLGGMKSKLNFDKLSKLITDDFIIELIRRKANDSLSALCFLQSDEIKKMLKKSNKFNVEKANEFVKDLGWNNNGSGKVYGCPSLNKYLNRTDGIVVNDAHNTEDAYSREYSSSTFYKGATSRILAGYNNPKTYKPYSYQADAFTLRKYYYLNQGMSPRVSDILSTGFVSFNAIDLYLSRGETFPHHFIEFYTPKI